MREFDKAVDPHEEDVKIFIVLFLQVRPPVFVAEIGFRTDIDGDACPRARLLAVGEQLRDPLVAQTERQLLEPVVGNGDLLQPDLLGAHHVFKDGPLAVAVDRMCMIITGQ